VWLADADGSPVETRSDAMGLIGDAMGAGADVLVVPTARLSPRFFDLTSGLAGEIAQAAVNYHRRLVVLGDVTAAVERSGAFRDWVRECDRGEHVWFVRDEVELERRIDRPPKSQRP
jgi:hypothetical protein